MKKIINKRKINIVVSIFLFLIMSFIILPGFFAKNIPDKNEINYTTGVFSIVHQRESTNFIKLNHINNSNDSVVYSCSYTAINNGRYSSCGDTKHLKKYVGNIVTVGWYYQDKFLWFENNMPQMVSIEMDNKLEKSYEETLYTIKNLRKPGFFMLIFITIGCIISYRINK